MLDLGLGLNGLATRSRFNPATLFAGGTGGVWYDPSDLTSMFQDSAGTTPAAVDSPVGRINDKSGNGNHAVQATSGKRPMLRSVGGRLCLEFDGVDDRLEASFALSAPMDRISAIRPITKAGDNQIIGSPNNAMVLVWDATAANIALYAGALAPQTASPADGTAAVITERHNGASSKLVVNSGAYATGDSGSGTGGGISLGNLASSFGTEDYAGNVALYGVLMIHRELTAAEVVQVRAYLAGKAGVAL